MLLPSIGLQDTTKLPCKACPILYCVLFHDYLCKYFVLLVEDAKFALNYTLPCSRACQQ